MFRMTYNAFMELCGRICREVGDEVFRPECIDEPVPDKGQKNKKVPEIPGEIKVAVSI
jgi:hypothetical protein